VSEFIRQNIKPASKKCYIIHMAIEQFADILLEKLRFISQAETVIGKPIQAGEHTTIIPVSRVSLGFGLGGHSGKGEITGSGGGASVEPVAFLVLSGDDVRIVPVTRDNSMLSKIVDLVPDVMSSFKKNK